MTPRTRTQVKLAERHEKAAKAVLQAPIGNADRIWYLRGVYDGLGAAIEEVGKIERADDDEEMP